MKKILISLLLSGCVTAGKQSLESKYLPGDCAVATPEYQKEQPSLKGVESFVYAVTTKGYHVVYVLPLIGPVDQSDVNREMLDTKSNKVDCSETSQKLLPQKEKESN